MEGFRWSTVNLGYIVSRLREAGRKRRWVRALIVFGSTLRNRPVRDVDVLLVAYTTPSIKDVLDLKYKLEEELKLPVDVIPANLAPPALVAEALRDGVHAYAADGLSDIYYRALGESLDIDVKVRMRSRAPRRGDV